MKKQMAQIKLFSALLALLSTVQGAIKPFTCPSYESNKDPMMVNQTLFGGLWFEYLYSGGYKGSNPYDCASWTMLAPAKVNDTLDSYDYDVIFHAINRTTNQSIYNQHKVICG